MLLVLFVSEMVPYVILRCNSIIIYYGLWLLKLFSLSQPSLE